MNMDLPPANIRPAKEDPPIIICNQCDIEVVHKIAQLLLPGLATACVDCTAGDLFRRTASVAVGIRKEMIDFLTQRSETYVAESEGLLDDPMEIVSQFLENFAALKRNLFGRVSGWLLSERREDKIDDFVQEMEIYSFWPIDRREALAEILLKNIDFKNIHHCPMKLETEQQQLEEHKNHCTFRSLSCSNQGCKTKFSARHQEEHDQECPYKVIPCEQMCNALVVRREMDRHCITVCPMRLVHCPFYQVGCQSAFAHCELQKHCSEFLNSHLLFVLQAISKQESTIDELKQRVQLMEKSQSLNTLSEALDVRSLTLAIKEQEAKLKKIELQVGKES